MFLGLKLLELALGINAGKFKILGTQWPRICSLDQGAWSGCMREAGMDCFFGLTWIPQTDQASPITDTLIMV